MDVVCEVSEAECRPRIADARRSLISRLPGGRVQDGNKKQKGRLAVMLLRFPRRELQRFREAATAKRQKGHSKGTLRVNGGKNRAQGRMKKVYPARREKSQPSSQRTVIGCAKTASTHRLRSPARRWWRTLHRCGQDGPLTLQALQTARRANSFVCASDALLPDAPLLATDDSSRVGCSSAAESTIPALNVTADFIANTPYLLRSSCMSGSMSTIWTCKTVLESSVPTEPVSLPKAVDRILLYIPSYPITFQGTVLRSQSTRSSGFCLVLPVQG